MAAEELWSQPQLPDPMVLATQRNATGLELRMTLLRGMLTVVSALIRDANNAGRTSLTMDPTLLTRMFVEPLESSTNHQEQVAATVVTPDIRQILQACAIRHRTSIERELPSDYLEYVQRNLTETSPLYTFAIDAKQLRTFTFAVDAKYIRPRTFTILWDA